MNKQSALKKLIKLYANDPKLVILFFVALFIPIFMKVLYYFTEIEKHLSRGMIYLIGFVFMIITVIILGILGKEWRRIDELGLGK